MVITALISDVIVKTLSTAQSGRTELHRMAHSVEISSTVIKG